MKMQKEEKVNICFISFIESFSETLVLIIEGFFGKPTDEFEEVDFGFNFNNDATHASIES